MSLYFIRHGQTVLNTKRMFNGEVDEDLDEVGRGQASKAGEKFKDKKIDLIYCSPLRRTRQTMALLNLDKSIPVIYDERLVERKAGKLAGKEIDMDFLQNVFLNKNTKERIEGMETVDEVFDRVHSVIDEIKKNHSDKNVLIVAHGFIGRAIHFYFNKLPESGKLGDCPESFPQNCEVREYEL